MVLESNTLDVLFVKDGQQGEDGKVLYTWIKYAKDANGTGMTDDPNGAIYIGISYNNESSIESNDPTQYAWTKIQGADGKKGEDAYTIFLENENISFATDENRNPLSEQAYTSGITIMKGAKPVTDFAIGDIAKTQGIAVAKTNTAIAISVVNGNPLPNDSGEIEIPITVGGTVFKKILTWTCAKKGDQGEQGERGLQGIQGPQGIQGVAGKDGTNGKTTYFHIKYSSVANPTSSSQLTETPSTYIGTYVDFTETDSTDPKKYTWSQFVGSQGPKGEQGIAGVGVDGKTSYLHIAYANSADGKTGFSTSDSTNKSYIGQYTDFTPNDSTDYTKYSWSLIRGKDGTDGVSPTVSVTKNGKTTTITITDKNGTHTQTVKDGTDGTPGQTGKDGKTTYFHVKYSNDGGQTFTSNSGEDVGAYIGTCTDYNQADPTTVGVYTWARIKGEKGDQGVRGEKGKDGTSVTITNKSITYQLSTSGTTIPTGTWQTSPQTIPEGQYQWTKTSVTYSDGNKTESYSISYHGKNGSDGTSVKTTSTSVKYQVGDSGTTKPTGTWQSNVPTVAQGKYLWTQTVVNYSDGNSTESYSVSYRGIDGSNGSNGMNAATVYLYQRATSTPSKPSNTLTYTFSTTKITGTLSNGWSTAIPTGTDAVYVTVASVSSKNDTTTIAASAWSAPVVLAQNGKTGSDGKAGLNVATIYLYQRNISKPSKPSASVTYTFSTGVASGLNNGWSQKIPDGTNPLYVTLATASSNTATDTILSSEWSDVVVMAQNGEDGQDGAGFHWNLLKYSGDLSKQVLGGAGTYTATVESIEDKTTPSGQAEKITYTVQGTGGKFIQTGKYIKEGDIKQGKTYTVSVWCKCSSIKSTGVINAEFLDNKTYVNPTLSTEWQQYVVTGVANKDVTSTSSASAISFYYNDNMSVGDIFYISSPKVEEGDKPSPWCTTYEETLAKNLSITPSSQYFKSTDGGKTFAPNTITIKPTIQGEINFGKWQYSIDGGVSFADVVSGQKGLTINNNVLSISKDSSLYSDAVTMVTFRAVANDSSFYDTCSIAKIYDVSDIGDGRNLLWNSNFAKTDEAITGTTNSWGLHTRGTNLVASIDTSTKHNGFNTLKTVSAVNGDKNSSNDLEWFAWGISERTSDNLHSKNQNYTLSFYAKASVTTDFIVRWGYDAYGADTTRTLTTNWQKYEIKLHQATSAYSITIIFKLLTAGTVWFSEFKLEKGSSATGYSTAPEDLQTAILSTKSEISDVSLKVDKNKQAIEQRVEKTTYQQDLNLVKGDISKANEGLNKWRYEIYPKSLFTDKPEDQRKISLDVFARNKNIIPTQSILLDDTKLGYFNYDDNYIGYAVTFVKMSEATKLETTFVHGDAGSFYLNGKLICTNGTNNFYSSATPDTVSCTLVKGWNCLEVVINEGAGSEGFKFGTVLSQLSTCQLMNCYYAMVTGRESQITNTLVQNTIDIEGVSTKVGKVTSIIGENGENFTDFKNDYSDFKQTMNGFKTTVGQTYVTKDDFNGLEIGGRNLLLYSQTVRAHNDYYNVGWLTDEVETFNGCPVWSVKNQWGKLGWSFKSHVIDRGLVKVGDTLTYSLYAKTNNASGKRIACSYRFKGNAQGYWFNDSAFNVDTSWARYSVTFTVTKDMLATDTYMNEIGFGETASMSGDDKVYYACPKLERGTKATDYTPAPEDNEINGQNLVSNLPSNWEQGGINGGQAVGSTYASIKSSTAYRIRIKDIFSVSGNITVSAGGTTTNSSKETLSFYGTLYDAKKGLLRETGWKSFPSTINCGDAKYMSIILRWGDGTKTQITPSDISQICLKIERGTSATPFTLAPEDVNGKIVNVETIANQTAKKFEWIVKGGDSSSNFTLTDRVADLVAERINFKGLVTFSGLNTDAKNEIGKVAQSKVDGLEVGGRNLLVQKNITEGYLSTDGKGSFVGSGGGDQTSDWIDVSGNKYITITLYEDFTNTNNSGRYCEYDADKNCISTIDYNPRQKSSVIIELKSNTKYIRVTAIECKTRRYKIEAGNKATDWTPAPEDVSQDATNKASQALTDAKNYSSNAVNWVTNNGSSTTSLNSMVKKWTDGAVSDTTQINGGWIKANTITASKIAVGDFTNYADINESNTYGFSVEKTTDGVWFSKDGSKLTRDNYISKMYSCEPGQTFYVEYDISNTIKDSTEYKAAGIMLFGCDGTQTVKWYQRRGAVVGTAAGTVTHMSQQLTMPSGTRFFYVVLQIEGFQPFTGTLKIRNLSVRKAVTGAVIVDGSITADKIATDAIKSRNYISSGGTQGSFLNLSDGSFQSPNLSWDSNGNLIASNANLSGLINATKGTVGGWNIATNGLYSGIDENAIKIYSATTYDAQTMYQKQKIQDSFILSQKYINHFVSQQVSVGHNIPYWQTRSFIYNDSQIQLAQSDYCINTSSASNYDAQYSLKDGYISATRIYMEQNITQVGGDVINSSFSIGLDSMMGWCSIQSTKGINIYGNSSRALYVQSNDTSKYNALETEGDVVVNGKIHAVSGDNKIQLNSDNNGSIELYGNTPFIDFHSAYSSADYTCRIIANTPEQLLVCGKLRCDSNIISNNDLIANSWVYAGQNAHYTWQNQLDCYFSCGYYNNTNNVYYYAGYHAFYVNNDSGSGMMYINTNGVTSRVGFTKTSDERIKKNFESFDDNIIDAYMNIEPVKYQLKQSSNDKYHFGFKAQHIDKVFSDYGDIYNESFDICTSRPIDPDKAKELYGVDGMVEEYGLRYDELIAPTTYMVQHTYKELESTKNELEQVKQEKADLETRLQAIEAKFGL